MNFLVRALLFPFAVLYDLGTRVRNHLFTIGYFSSVRFEVPVISVGNLRVGGSGKTPLVEYIIRVLRVDLRCGVVSRGYGRSSRGLRIADAHDDAATLGDEPFQLWTKFGPEVTIAVCEERDYAIPHVLHSKQPDAIVLDDAFQHRSVTPTLSILVTEYSRPFYSDFILPAGRLREARIGARRADIVVVSKCPETIDLQEQAQIRTSIRKYAGNKPVHFATIAYGEISWNRRPINADRVILVTGVADPGPLETYLSSRFLIVRHFRYRDHHRYSKGDIRSMLDAGATIGGPYAILTTEKDWAKLSGFAGMLSGMSTGVVPIEYRFIGNGSEFDHSVRYAAGLQ